MNSGYGRDALVSRIAVLLGRVRESSDATERHFSEFATVAAETIADELTVESDHPRMPEHTAIVDVVERTLVGTMPFRTEKYDPAAEQQHGKIDRDVAHALGVQIASTLYADSYDAREIADDAQVHIPGPSIIYVATQADGTEVRYDLSRDDVPAPPMGDRDAAIARALLLLAVDRVEAGHHRHRIDEVFVRTTPYAAATQNASAREPDTGVWAHTFGPGAAGAAGAS